METKLMQPISGKEISKWLPNATILKYSELKGLKKLPKLPLILLYEIKHNFGHWVTILKTPEGIEHFDSYGYAPDNELDFVPDYFKYESDQNYKYLLNLLINSNQEINYNPYPLQKGVLTATCGRWTILRNIFDYLTTDEFNQIVNNVAKKLKISTDEVVSYAI